MNVDQHNDLEAIRQLKARYFRTLDMKDWDGWGDCFTSDILAIYEGAPRPNKDAPTEMQVEGSKTLVDACSNLMIDATTIHQGFMPEIELTSATTASGVWAMFDSVRFPTSNFKGWGHYHDDYVKVDGEWKIKKTHLTRLHTEDEWL